MEARTESQAIRVGKLTQVLADLIYRVSSARDAKLIIASEKHDPVSIPVRYDPENAECDEADSQVFTLRFRLSNGGRHVTLHGFKEE